MAQHRLLVGTQQAVAPVERRAHRALAGRQVARTFGGRASRRASRLGGSSSRARAAASSRASGSPASRSQIASTATSSCAPRPQPGLTASARERSSSTAGGPGRGSTARLDLATHPQRRPARREQGQPRRGLDERRQRRRGVEDVLEVVERPAAAGSPARARGPRRTRPGPGSASTASASTVTTPAASATGGRGRRSAPRRPRPRRSPPRPRGRGGSCPPRRCRSASPGGARAAARRAGDVVVAPDERGRRHRQRAPRARSGVGPGAAHGRGQVRRRRARHAPRRSRRARRRARGRCGGRAGCGSRARARSPRGCSDRRGRQLLLRQAGLLAQRAQPLGELTTCAHVCPFRPRPRPRTRAECTTSERPAGGARRRALRGSPDGPRGVPLAAHRRGWRAPRAGHGPGGHGVRARRRRPSCAGRRPGSDDERAARVAAALTQVELRRRARAQVRRPRRPAVVHPRRPRAGDATARGRAPGGAVRGRQRRPR